MKRVMARSMRRSHCSSKLFGPRVSLPWSIAEQTQASYTLPCILRERCLGVRAGKNFLDFPLVIQYLAGMALSQPQRSTAHRLGSRTWPMSSMVSSTSTSIIVLPSMGRTSPSLQLQLLWIHSIHREHWLEVLPTPLQQTAQGYLPDSLRTSWSTP